MARAALPGRLTTLAGERLVWREAKLVATVAETARVRTLELDVPGWPGHRPGQHVDVRLTADDGYQAQRKYSIASAPSAGRLALTVERIEDGEVSPFLVDELAVGDRFDLRGPIGGHFVWEPGDGRPVLLVAGGSGIVPLASMLRTHAAAGSDVPVRLLYSSRTLADVINRDELARLAGGPVEVVHTLTRERPATWGGRAGRIDAAMLAEVAWPAAADALAFVCGPNGLVEAVGQVLVGLGYPPASVRTERFGPSG